MTGQVLIDNLCFCEGPRWREGALWLSDMHDRKVLRIQPDGSCETILELEDDEPSGLGWLPNGDLLIVSMRKRQLLRYDGNQLTLSMNVMGESMGTTFTMEFQNGDLMLESMRFKRVD